MLQHVHEKCGTGAQNFALTRSFLSTLKKNLFVSIK